MKNIKIFGGLFIIALSFIACSGIPTYPAGENKTIEGTKVFNYGRPQVANFLIANALFWVEKYHLDGLQTL